MADRIDTTIEPSIVRRVADGLRYAVTGKTPGWMSPLEPLKPVVPESQQRDGVDGRQWDFPVGFNTQIAPRTQLTPFSQLRFLAQSYSVLRTVIETRKDQIGAMKCKITGNANAEAFFARPDRKNSFSTWSRMLVEEMLVTDAAAVYPMMTRGGDLYSLELVDGTTLSAKIDAFGRIPTPPEIAYQQVIKGIPSRNYTTDEMIYAPRNKRVHTVYGFSPVEQIMLTVNMAMRREIAQMQYFTEGSTPNLILTVPETWNVNQIRELDAYWNGLLSGNTAERQRTRFLPGGVNTINTRDQVLKDQFDEWLARVVCFAFSIPATPFVAQVNRATAETAQQTAMEEGLMPLMQWFEELMNDILGRFFPGAEFAWDKGSSLDPLKQAQIDQIYLTAGIVTADEIRERMGLAALPVAEAPAAPDVPPPPDDGVTKAQKKKPLNLETAEAERLRIELHGVISGFLAKIGKECAASEGVEKGEEEIYRRILKLLESKRWIPLIGEIEPILRKLADVGQLAAAYTVAAVNFEPSEATIAYAKARAAEMIGMRWIDGELVENPDAEWSISETTRDMVRAHIAAGIEAGTTNADIAASLVTSGAFADSRADTIARTETAIAQVAGAEEAYRDLGVNEWEWLASPECCDDCQEMDGKTAPVGGVFEGGATVPLHPNCRCALMPV